MARPARQRDALQVIFAFFLGLMVAAFIGMGVYTFHPPNTRTLEEQARELQAEQSELRLGHLDEEADPEQQARLDAVIEQLREVEEQRRDRQEAWARSTSVVLVLLSTLVMGISLVRADQLPVISNGLLLGGVFTMLYGTGWTLAAGESQLRFWVTAFALVVTIGLGYLRFVRGQAAPARPGAPATELDDLGGRLAELERRMDAAGEAFRSRNS